MAIPVRVGAVTYEETAGKSANMTLKKQKVAVMPECICIKGGARL